MQRMRVELVALEGTHVRLEPLSHNHLLPLCAVGFEAEIWRWTQQQVRTEAEMGAYVEVALREYREGTALPFATVAKAENRVVGSTRFGNIDIRNKRVEIGWTWVAPPWQRTIVNTEAKYLMLCHAFETMGCVRVEFKTDALNERSRGALLRIGAKEEGTLRKHMITSTGRQRDSVYYSILDHEWASVKSSLAKKLAG